MRRTVLVVVSLAASSVVAFSACGVDDALTCGAGCDPDASVRSDAANGGGSDAGSDSSGYAGCQGIACGSSCCRGGEICGGDTKCCAPLGVDCERDSDCCTDGTCSDRKCVRCLAASAGCSTFDDLCCDGTYCQGSDGGSSNRCTTCRALDAGCSSDRSCCSGECTSGLCRPKP